MPVRIDRTRFVVKLASGNVWQRYIPRPNRYGLTASVICNRRLQESCRYAVPNRADHLDRRAPPSVYYELHCLVRLVLRVFVSVQRSFILRRRRAGSTFQRKCYSLARRPAPSTGSRRYAAIHCVRWGYGCTVFSYAFLFLHRQPSVSFLSDSCRYACRLIFTPLILHQSITSCVLISGLLITAIEPLPDAT